VKIYVVVMEVLKKDKMKLNLPSNLMVHQFHPLLNANVLFCKFFLNLTLCMTKFKVQT